MNMYKTNCCLGYNEYAILIECDEGFLCIDTNENSNKIWKTYNIGELVLNIDEGHKKQMIKIDNDRQKHYIDESPLKYDFLFNYFLKNIIKKD